MSAEDRAELMRMSKAELMRRQANHRASVKLSGIIIIGISFFFVYINSQFNGYEVQAMNVWSLICLAFFLPLFVFCRNYLKEIDSVLSEKKAEEAEAAKKASDADALRRHEAALDLVKRCEEFGIVSLGNEDDKQNLWIVAESMGIASKEQAIELYQEGRNPSADTVAFIEKLQAEKQAAERTEKSQRDFHFNEYRLKQSAPDIVGRERYLGWAEILRDRLQKEIESLDASSKVMATYPSAYPAPQKNITKEAMEGQLVGGAGLAAAKAMGARDFNARSAKTSADLAMGMAKLSLSYSKKAERDRDYLQETLKYLSAIGKKLMDTEHTDKYAEMVHIGVVEPTVTDGGNLNFGLEVSVDGTPEILGRKAFLDGTVDITARLGSHVLGNASWCPWDYPSRQNILEDDLSEVAFRALSNKRYAGFNRITTSKNTRDIYIFPDISIAAEDLPSIDFEVKPRKIWAVEGESDGLLYSFE